jgi:hypothetical protein
MSDAVSPNPLGSAILSACSRIIIIATLCGFSQLMCRGYATVVVVTSDVP